MRTVTHELNESDVDSILKALERYEGQCRRSAKSAMQNGYGTVVSISKSEEWNKKADKLRELQSRIANQMDMIREYMLLHQLYEVDPKYFLN